MRQRQRGWSKTELAFSSQSINRRVWRIDQSAEPESRLDGDGGALPAGCVHHGEAPAAELVLHLRNKWVIQDEEPMGEEEDIHAAPLIR